MPRRLFACGAKRLPLAILNFVKHPAPSINDRIAMIVYGKEMSATTLISFVLI